MATVLLSEALDPDYVADLDRLPLADVRERRLACTQLETDLSYLRRVVQGRIDIIVSESHRRDGAADEVDLVDRLPEILAEQTRSPGAGRLTALMAPSEKEQEALTARIDEAFPEADAETIAGSPPEVLTAALDRLSALERTVSAERRALHDILDRLQEEVIRRYRTGEASVDSLLS